VVKLRTTADIRLRFTSPKLAPVGRQLRVLAKRYPKYRHVLKGGKL